MSPQLATVIDDAVDNLDANVFKILPKNICQIWWNVFNIIFRIKKIHEEEMNEFETHLHQL